MTSDNFLILSWTSEMAKSYAMEHAAETRLESYYSCLFYHDLRPGDYFVFGGAREFNEASIFVSGATRLFMGVPFDA